MWLCRQNELGELEHEKVVKLNLNFQGRILRMNMFSLDKVVYISSVRILDSLCSLSSTSSITVGPRSESILIETNNEDGPAETPSRAAIVRYVNKPHSNSNSTFCYSPLENTIMVSLL